MKTIRIDYRAVNAAGAVLYTFGDRDVGRAWVRENAYRHDGLVLEEVTTTAKRDYRPRVVRRDPFVIPRFHEARA